jgi:hypothetical protein
VGGESRRQPTPIRRATQEASLIPICTLLIEDTVMFGGTLLVPSWLEAWPCEQPLPGDRPEEFAAPLGRDEDDEGPDDEEEEDEDEDEDDEDFDDEDFDEDLDDEFDEDFDDDEDFDEDFDEDLDDDLDEDEDDEDEDEEDDDLDEEV